MSQLLMACQTTEGFIIAIFSGRQLAYQQF